uniref:Ig-like domain-containing protein n=1 Tax=Leptobrachium leishanense TaxID=445787 RepID=A0A8C5PWJ7_9ANUR
MYGSSIKLFLYAHFQLYALSGIEITVSVGSTALLPCTFNGCRDSGAAYQVLWQKKGKGTERLVVHFQKGNVEFNNLAKNYANRTSMDWNWMQLGNATLQLRNVSMKDSGEYTCWVRGLPQGSRSVHERCQVVLCVQSSRSASQCNVSSLCCVILVESFHHPGQSLCENAYGSMSAAPPPRLRDSRNQKSLRLFCVTCVV